MSHIHVYRTELETDSSEVHLTIQSRRLSDNVIGGFPSAKASDIPKDFREALIEWLSEGKVVWTSNPAGLDLDKPQHDYQ